MWRKDNRRAAFKARSVSTADTLNARSVGLEATPVDAVLATLTVFAGFLNHLLVLVDTNNIPATLGIFVQKLHQQINLAHVFTHIFVCVALWWQERKPKTLHVHGVLVGISGDVSNDDVVKLVPAKLSSVKAVENLFGNKK